MQLADEVNRIVYRAQSRVLGVGHEQYVTRDANGEEVQKFETMDLDALIEYAIEETLDHINYGVMLTLRLERLRSLHQRIERLHDGAQLQRR